MKIISFINSKGGVGKTTLATNLARFLSTVVLFEQGILDLKKVLLVDADPQGSLRDWNEAGEQKHVDMIIADTKQTLLKLPITFKHSDYDYIVIDTPGKATEVTGAAIAISDVCLIPVQPSPYDLWASNDVIELIQTRQTVANGKPLVFYVLNRCIPNTKISKEVFEYINHGHISILGDTINQRVIYAETARDGKTVFDSSSEAAKNEISILGERLISKIEGKHELQ